MTTIIGADLALNHGSLVRSDGLVLYTYTEGWGMQSYPDQLWQLAEQLTAVTPRNCIIAIDWSKDSGHWGKDATVAVLITMLISAYAAMCKIRGNCTIHFIDPSTVRYCLGLPPTAHKKLCHSAVREVAPRFEDDGRYYDQIDAWILSYVYKCSFESEVHFDRIL